MRIYLVNTRYIMKYMWVELKIDILFFNVFMNINSIHSNMDNPKTRQEKKKVVGLQRSVLRSYPYRVQYRAGYCTVPGYDLLGHSNLDGRNRGKPRQRTLSAPRPPNTRTYA